MKIAGGDIVTDGIPEDIVQCILFADVVSVLPDDNAQLALVVKQFLRVWVDLDVVQWPCEAIGRGCKDDWFLWRWKLPCVSELPLGSLEGMLTFVSLAWDL